MTRVVGFRRTLSPCCKSPFLETAFASINFSASELWTDGHREASLAPTDGGVRRCGCGYVYTTTEAMYLPGLVRDDAGDHPRGLRVRDTDLSTLLEQGRHSVSAYTTLRRRLWRFRNEPYRKQYREIKQGNTSAFPAYELDDDARENLVQLAELLATDREGNALELAEIYRAIGEPLKAEKALQYQSTDALEARLSALMRQLLEMGLRGPVRYRL